ncbi:hypothetical protein [Candidatus Pelagibacter sp.]|uniref:hypothetical protein n=1 Tax=Candidatus Pelagibacter sp. TaxID=2024849 RepID=UPI003F84162A
MKKLIYIITFLILTSCGFQPINNALNYNFIFKEVEISAEPIIKKELKKFFSKQQNVSNKSGSIYEILINGSSDRSISAKNSSGIATIYKTTISINVILKSNEKEILKKNYLKEIQYNDQSSKFELKQYENILKKDLVREISIDILNDIATTND